MTEKRRRKQLKREHQKIQAIEGEENNQRRKERTRMKGNGRERQEGGREKIIDKANSLQN